MEIKIQKALGKTNVQITDGNTTIRFCTLEDSELERLAKEFCDALWAMGPVNSEECDKWILKMFSDIGVNLSSAVKEGQNA